MQIWGLQARAKALRQERIYSQEQKEGVCAQNTVDIEVRSKRWGHTSSNLIASIDAKKIEFGHLRNGTPTRPRTKGVSL